MSKPHVNSSICENNFQFLNAASVILILDIFFCGNTLEYMLLREL